MQRRQAGADVGVVEVLVAADEDLADHAFGDLQAHDAGGEFLLRHVHLHRAEARGAIRALERFERFLDVAIDPLGPHQRRHRALHFGFRQQRIAFDLETDDVEMIVLGQAGERLPRYANESANAQLEIIFFICLFPVQAVSLVQVRPTT